MKSHEQKQNRYRTREKKKGKTNGDKKTNQKKRKGNKTLSQKAKKGRDFFLRKCNKRKEPKIKILTHELLAFTLSYLMLSLW
jgi:hypothetical protein